MMQPLLLVSVLFGLLCFQAIASIEVPRWVNDPFVTTSDGSFFLGNRTFRHYGTNAYWLNMLTDDDLDSTFASIAGAGYTVVRTWAFNDVAEVPASGTYFQVLCDGTATINTGANGLQRLDQVVSYADKYGLKLLLSLTNNWNPARNESSVSVARREESGLARGYLSNDYGGMDAYVRAFCPDGTHDTFYTDLTIIEAFKKYVSAVVSRYVDDTTILGWEVANDLRCASTIPASSACNTTVVTTWVNEIAGYIKSLDSNHLITPGDGGFYCLGCQKIYAPATVLPAPSAALTGATFDGSYGVDTQDLISIPCISFGSFQLFPDIQSYFPSITPNFAIDAIGQGFSWTQLHSETAGSVNKPTELTAFGLVTAQNWQYFVPPYATGPVPGGPTSGSGGIDNSQRDVSVVAWSSVSLNGNIGGILEYAWAGNDLTGVSSKRQMAHSPPNEGYPSYPSPNSQTIASVTSTSNTPGANVL